MKKETTLTPEFCALVQRIEDSGLNAEVVADALLIMKEHPNSSPLLSLQVAAANWDI
jgi:hypothetical protein